MKHNQIALQYCKRFKILYNNFTSTRVDVINKGDGMYVQDHEEELIQQIKDGIIVFLSGASS